MALDTENPLNVRPSRTDGAVQVPAWGLVTDAELCLVRLNAAGQVEHAARCGGTFIAVRGQRFHSDSPAHNDVLLFLPSGVVVFPLAPDEDAREPRSAKAIPARCASRGGVETSGTEAPGGGAGRGASPAGVGR